MWSLLGESDKWVTVSESRFRGLSVTGSGAEVTAVGGIGEKMTVRFADPAGAVTTVGCVFDARETLVISSVNGCV
jgi:hypothetical protein